jgi:hypothetical protein
VLWFVLFIVLVLCVVVRAVHRFSFMCYGSCCSSLYFYVLCFVRLRPVSCFTNDANIFGLSILDCPFGFHRAVHRFSFMCCGSCCSSF